MEQFILENLNDYGPVAVFVLLLLSGLGLPFGEDVIVIPAGALVADGKMPWWPTLIWTWFGVVLSDTAWFLICSHFGTRLLHTRWAKRIFHPRRMLEAKHQLDERGVWLIVFARFIPGSRTYANTVAGMLHMPLWKFVVATALPTCITAPAQLGIGWFIGSHVSTDNVGHMLIKVFGIVMLVLAATLALNVYLAHRRSQRRAPRAKARWLRTFRRRAVAIVTHAKAHLEAPSRPSEPTPTSADDSPPADEHARAPDEPHRRRPVGPRTTGV